MASAALGDELSCSICLNLYTEPVSLRCGHHYCQDCIRTALDKQDGSPVYSCPECREEYAERPTLEKNRKLCNIVENFRSTQQKEEKSEVFCTYCVDSPLGAVKTCLHCETSMCDKHLTAHNKTVDHVLVEPISSFSGKKCSIHKKLLEYYCSEDTACLCVSCCLVGKHKGHEVELLEDALEKKENLRRVLEKLTTKRKTTEEKIQSLQDQKKKVQTKEEDEKKRVSALFEDLRRQLEVQEQKVLSVISRQVEEISLSVSGLIRQLEIQKDDLSSKICQMEKLCSMTDPITVLRDHKSHTDKVLQDLDSDTGDGIVEESSVHELDEFMISLMLHKSISDLFCNIQLQTNFYTTSRDLLLNEKTANNYVALSDDMRTATYFETKKIRPELPERFTIYSQVMSVESFSHGRHYWEVEVGDCGNWDVAVCYPSMDKKEEDKSAIGLNNKSWSFNVGGNKYTSLHDSQKQTLIPESPVQRLGVYLDYEKGRLSYYQLCDPIRHLHTFTTTFTQPLHAAFYLEEEAWVKLISPVFSVKL